MNHALLSFQVALLANRLPERVRQFAGVHDGVVRLAGFRPRAGMHVQLPRPMTPLATNRRASREERLLVAVLRTRFGAERVSVAEQAIDRHGAAFSQDFLAPTG